MPEKTKQTADASRSAGRETASVSQPPSESRAGPVVDNAALEPLLFELSRGGLGEQYVSSCDVPAASPEKLLGAELVADAPPPLPEIGELQLVRHYTHLAELNFSVDANFYPLGSCTMKYNPKIDEWAASLRGFADIHPYLPAEMVQGALRLLYELQVYLAEIAGLAEVSLQPAAGAHGELTGLKVITAYHRSRGQDRRKVLTPDSAHGTNPASCTITGRIAVPVKSGRDGLVDLDDLRSKVDEDTAAMMITNPNTLGLFETHIAEIADILHAAGALLYLDGANMNAILGIARPGDFGVDAMHFNLHKTFGTPHGCGGPGSGPIAVIAELAPFLPVPQVVKTDQGYALDYDRPRSIGKVRSFFGQFSVLVRAYAYIRALGPEGLRRVSETAVLAANYLAARLKDRYELPYDRICKHEFVLSATKQKTRGASALDIAKRLIDFGIHPPTIYFPLIVPECLMIEPTESESLQMLDEFVGAMLTIADEIDSDPRRLHDAPERAPVARVDEVTAARKPIVRFEGVK